MTRRLADFGQLPLARKEAALLTAAVTRRAIEEIGPEVALFHHGIYVPQGIIGEVCRKLGVRVVNWAPAYRKQSFLFSHENTYHQTLMDEPISTWTDMTWSDQHEEEIRADLRSRWQGTRDWIWFHLSPQEDVDAIKKEVGIDFSKPTIGLLTNVVWDAQLHYKANAFSTMIDWVLDSVAYFKERPDCSS